MYIQRIHFEPMDESGLQLDCEPAGACPSSQCLGGASTTSIDEFLKDRASHGPCGKYFLFEDRLPGPANASQSMHWAFEDFQSLEVQGQKFFSCNFAEVARLKMIQGVCLTTDYSGIGSPEEALQQLLEACIHRSEEAEESPDNIRCWFVNLRAGDVASHCRGILKQHKGAFHPRCVHGNILDRCPKALMARVERVRTRALSVLEQSAQRGKPKDAASMIELGRSAMREVAKFMLQPCQADADGLTAFCEVHNTECTVIKHPDTGFEGIRLHVAGVNCFDWSRMGHQRRWLGDSMPVFAQWARERMMSLEDIIIVECVVEFDSDLLGEMFARHYSLRVLRFSPTLFGEPVARERKYMVLLKKDRLEWRADIEQFGVAETFLRLFARTVRMSGHEKFRAKQEDVSAYLESLAAQRRLPSRTRSGKAWSFWQLASPSMRASIQAHETALRDEVGQRGSLANWICNLSQKPSYIPAKMFVVPTLLRSSKLWLFEKRRWPLPLELLEIQGWNIWGCDGLRRLEGSATSEASAQVAIQREDPHLECDLVEHFKQLSHRQMESVAGNSMHLRAVGAAMLFCFACTQKPPMLFSD